VLFTYFSDENKKKHNKISHLFFLHCSPFNPLLDDCCSRSAHSISFCGCMDVCGPDYLKPDQRSKSNV